MFQAVGFDPATANHVSALAEPGNLFCDGAGNIYRYVKFVDAVTYAAGQVVTYASDDAKSVTNDVSGGSSLGLVPAGIVMCAMTQNYYGYILVSGVHSAVLTDGGVAVGEALVAHSVDGEADTMADGEEEQVFGFALATDSGATESCPAIIRLL